MLAPIAKMPTLNKLVDWHPVRPFTLVPPIYSPILPKKRTSSHFTQEEHSEPSQTFIFVSSQNIHPANRSDGRFDELSPKESILTERSLQVPVTTISFLPSTRIPALTGDLHRGALHRLTRPTLFLFPRLPVTPPTQLRFPYVPTSRITKLSCKFHFFLKFHCYGFLVSHMIPSALVSLHGQYTLNWIMETMSLETMAYYKSTTTINLSQSHSQIKNIFVSMNLKDISQYETLQNTLDCRK